MKTIKVYLYSELSPTAKITAEAGATFWASHALMNSGQVPPHLVPQAWQKSRDEYLAGHFDAGGEFKIAPKLLGEEEKVNGQVTPFPGRS